MTAGREDPSGRRQKLMEQVADHAAREHAADEGFERPEHRSLRWVVVLLLAAVAVGVVAWNVREVRSGTPPLAPDAQERSLVAVVTVLSRQVERVRSATGAFPVSLAAVAPPLDGVTYRRTEGGYALEAVAGDVVVTFVSDRDPQLLTGRVADVPGGPR
ncbi:MAG TPA: hypothetical protein VLH75_01140 [Longimicrobiales bacterium]|nr:hypothetical protein [Longimicrobiales bacterium]